MTARFLCLAFALAAALPVPVQAKDAPILAEYWTDSGSLPPEYAWDTIATIRADGALTLKHCTGYETEGPACKTRRAKVSPDALTAITAAARNSGLAAKPARETDTPIIGGGLTGGRVFVDGAEIKLIEQPVAADAARIAPVLSAITAAIPARFDRFLDPD